MKTVGGKQIKPASVRDDRVGKPFLVVSLRTRQCLVCEEFFFRHEAFRHSRVVCYPHETRFTRGERGCKSVNHSARLS